MKQICLSETGSQKVGGSNPPSSTKEVKEAKESSEHISISSNSCLNNTPAYVYLSSRLVKITYLFANLIALVYNVFNSFGFGYYKLLIIPSYLY